MTDRIIQTTLDIPGVFRIEEASNKAIQQLSRLSENVRVSFVATDVGCIIQPGDVISVVNSYRGINCKVWVESSEMMSYARWRITGIRYSSAHFSDIGYGDCDEIGKLLHKDKGGGGNHDGWLIIPSCTNKYCCDAYQQTAQANGVGYWVCDDFKSDVVADPNNALNNSSGSLILSVNSVNNPTYGWDPTSKWPTFSPCVPRMIDLGVTGSDPTLTVSNDSDAPNLRSSGSLSCIVWPTESSTNSPNLQVSFKHTSQTITHNFRYGNSDHTSSQGYVQAQASSTYSPFYNIPWPDDGNRFMIFTLGWSATYIDDKLYSMSTSCSVNDGTVAVAKHDITTSPLTVGDYQDFSMSIGSLFAVGHISLNGSVGASPASLYAAYLRNDTTYSG